MSTIDRYDILVLGSGEAGKYIAWTLANQGCRAAVVEALIAADSDRILGFTALGAEAGELIAVVQTAMLTKAPYTTLRDSILTHPTIAEGLTVLFASEPMLAPTAVNA